MGGEATRRRRIDAIDWLKALAVFAVVVAHSGLAPFPGAPRWTAWDTAFRHLLPDFHVPCLLMISGFLYHRSHAIGLSEVWPRARRILVPYLLASLAALLLNQKMHPTPAAKLWAIATGSALHVYYYVFVLMCCVALLPLISRLSLRGLRVVVSLLLLYLAATCVDPALRLSSTPAWAMRSPFESFALGYFLLGWIAAVPAPAHSVTSPATTRVRVTAAAALVWPLTVFLGSPYPLILVAKIPYALAVWQSATVLLAERPVPPSFRRFSDASYGVYLYHFLFQDLVRRHLASWHAFPRLLALIAVGLLGALLLGALLRRLFGERRARFLFGF